MKNSIKMLRFILIMTMALEIYSTTIDNDVSQYFKSDSVQKIREKWSYFEAPLENAILAALKESFGYRSLNVLIRKTRQPRQIATGYLHDDSQVQLLLKNLYLESIPYMWMPEVKFKLPDNVLTINALLSKMIVRSKYVAFRNGTHKIQEPSDKATNSPFTFEQVQPTGDLAMLVEGCELRVQALTMLNGPSVNVGSPSFRLVGCRFSFEIFQQGSSAPPVIIDYDPTNPQNNIDILNLLLVPLQEELIPKLQSAIFSYVNTTALFGDSLSQIREEQERIFRKTWSYSDKVAGNLNKLTLNENLGNIKMNDFNIVWHDSSQTQEIQLNNMVLSGVESLHISHLGGPYKGKNNVIVEQYRFNSLQVSGQIVFSGSNKTNYDFAIVMKDLTVDVGLVLPIPMPRKERRLSYGSMDAFVTGWRSVIFLVPTANFMHTEALIGGHMYNIVPSLIVNHLQKLFRNAVDYADKNEYIKTNIEDNKINKDVKCPFGGNCNENSNNVKKITLGFLEPSPSGFLFKNFMDSDSEDEKEQSSSPAPPQSPYYYPPPPPPQYPYPNSYPNSYPNYYPNPYQMG